MLDTALLTRHLGEALGRPIEIRTVEPLYGGACQDNFKVSLSEGPPLVLRSDAPTSLPGSLGRSDEHEVIRVARSRGVKTPDVLGLGVGLVHAGSAAYFMSWADGVAIGRHVVRGAALANAREGLAVELARELTRIHTITPITHPGLFPGRDRTERTDPVLAQLVALRRSIDTLPHRRPALELAYAWLAANRPAAREVTLVHGDFRTGNFLVSPEGLSAVLDWEFAHFGSPHDDVAWLCVRDWRFGELNKPVGGFSEREPFYAAYEAESGRTLDRVALHWWEVFGNVRWGAGALHQGRRYSEQKDLELVAIARRAGEMEFEALRLIRKGSL